VSDPLVTVKSGDEHSLGVVAGVIALAGFGKATGFPAAVVSTSARAAKRPIKLSFSKVDVVPGDRGIVDFGCDTSNWTNAGNTVCQSLSGLALHTHVHS